MGDALITAGAAVLGIVILAAATVALAVKTRGDRCVRWRGFGVEFEMRPCTDCARRG